MAQKKVRDIPIEERRYWINVIEPLPITHQCVLAGTNRSTVYAVHCAFKINGQELILLDAIDVEYTRHPFFGRRKMKHY